MPANTFNLYATIHEIRNRPDIRKKYPLGMNARELYKEIRGAGVADPRVTVKAIEEELKMIGKN